VARPAGSGFAASHALDRKGAERGRGPLGGLPAPPASMIPAQVRVSRLGPLEPHPYNPARAKAAPGRGGVPQTASTAGDLYPWPPYHHDGRGGPGGYLGAVGDQGCALRTMERARLLLGRWPPKKIHGLCVCINAVSTANAASRMAEGRVPSDGAFLVRGARADIDALYKQQSRGEPTPASGRSCCTRSSGTLHERVPLRADHGLHLAERG